MPNTESKLPATGILLCYGLPEVLVRALNDLAHQVHWRAEAVSAIPEKLPDAVVSGLCLLESDAMQCQHLPATRLLVLGFDAHSVVAEAPILSLPMRAEVLQQVLERIRVSADIRGLGGLVKYYIRTNDKTLRRDDRDSVVTLTDREVDITGFLLSEPTGASRAELLAQVWGYGSTIETQTLETHVSRLRMKLKTVGLKLDIVAGRYFLHDIAYFV